MQSPKTVFITCFFGLIARDVLGTDVLKILKQQKDLRIIILASQKKKPLLEEQFANGNVVVEGVPDVPLSFVEKIVYAVFRDLLNTKTRSILRLVKFKQDKSRIDYFLASLLAFFGRFSVVVGLAQRFFSFLGAPEWLGYYFEKYNPQLVFSTDIVTFNDVRFLRAARRRKIPTVGMVRSWDNLTVYNSLQVIPDKIVVQNAAIKQELLNYQFLPDKNIFIVGIPHYDHYVIERRMPRKDFLLKILLDPKRKTVMFTAIAEKHLADQETNIKIIKALAQLDVNVLVRLPVMGDIDLDDFSPPLNVFLDKPIRTKESVDATLTKKANDHLADSLFNSDVVVTGPSTIMIDAVVFNKPVVYVDFDCNKMPYWQSATRFGDYNHIRTILDTGGVKVARSLSQLKELVEQYLNNPCLDESQRQALALQKRWKLDGKSSERLADIIIKSLNY